MTRDYDECPAVRTLNPKPQPVFTTTGSISSSSRDGILRPEQKKQSLAPCHGVYPFCCVIWGFPKIRGTILGVPIIRTIVYWGLYLGPLI